VKALVVDDSMTIRRIVIKALQAVGITEYAEAANGVEAVTAVKNDQFDVILLDWNMPQMSGIDTLKAIRQAGLKTHVIMVTTEAERARVVEAIQAGVNDYLMKPFAPEKLAEKLKQALPAKA
jgi:two-component system chemotaxis response regulator CheY